MKTIETREEFVFRNPEFDLEENERMRRRMKNWDRKLNHLDDEMLYYVFNKASRIIEKRMEKENEEI